MPLEKLRKVESENEEQYYDEEDLDEYEVDDEEHESSKSE